ncbi:MAG: MvdC/MvdD family ATP grasp protein [Actinomycetota bacterium]
MAKVLIVSHDRDVHTSAVLAELSELGTKAAVLDLSTLPQLASLSYDYDQPTTAMLYDQTSEPSLVLEDFGAVWWRRPQYLDLSHVTDGDARSFSEGEWDEALSGLWPMLDAFWINEPHVDRLASRKAWQLKEAKRIGLRIPRTLITNNPVHARAFIESCGGPEHTIYKSFSATYAAWRETRRLRPDELELLDAVSVAPVIFQEYVPAGVNLRVTVVGADLFPAVIETNGTDYEADFRMSLSRGVPITEGTIPPEVETNLLALMHRLRLVYGAIDLRRSPDGDYYFLEVNTAGQWLFVEEETGQPIARTLATKLAKEAATHGTV